MQECGIVSSVAVGMGLHGLGKHTHRGMTARIVLALHLGSSLAEGITS